MESLRVLPERSLAAAPDWAEKSYFSCFRVEESSRPDQAKSESSVSSPEEMEAEAEEPKGEPSVEICIKCPNIFMFHGAAGEDPMLCPGCNVKKEEDPDTSFDYSEGSCDGSALEEDVPTGSSSDESFKPPTQYKSRENYIVITLDESLDDLVIVLDEEEPETASDRKEAQSPDDRCAAADCKGTSRYRVHCNACPRTFHTRCLGLPDSEFTYFRCDRCRRDRKEDIEEDPPKISERRPQELVFRKSNPPPPILCYICNGRVLLDLGPLYVEPGTRHRCLRCISGREIMV